MRPDRLSPTLLAISLALLPVATSAQAGKWRTLSTTNLPVGREECSFAQAGDKFYLLGGRGIQAVEEFNPATRAWRKMKNTPVEMNHFQALSAGGLIYVIGAFYASYPHELPVPNIYILDPLSDTWIKGALLPVARLRGSAGLVEHGGKFYSVLGIKDGHSAGWVPWLDEYDPATGAWRTLPDAPRERDHFQAAIHGGKIYAIGGRRSSYKPDIFTDLEKVDVFDLAGAGTWSTLASPGGDLKLKRSGSILATLGDEILVAGGGSNSNGANAHSETDAFNVKTLVWRALAPLNRGRQVTGGFINNGALYVASGSGGSGGSPVLQTMEAWSAGDSTAPTGAPLTPGQVGSGEASFNLGVIASGQTGSRVMALRHAGGTQAVLVASMRIVGDAGFKIKTQPAGPFLVRPDYPAPVELTFTSTGAVPTESHLEVTAAIPPGLVVRLPLEANKTPLALLRRPGRPGKAGSIDGFATGWEFLTEMGRKDAQGRALP